MASGVQLSTFSRWATNGVIGYKTKNIEGKVMVNEIWCKTCATHAHKIIPTLRGQAVKDFQKYVSGTKFVTKWTVMRHFESKGHASSLQFEKLLGSSLGESSNTASNKNNNNDRGTQPRLESSIQNAARNAYRKLIRTAYFLAARGQPLAAFKTVVDIQKANGVQLISGADSGKRAYEMIMEISSAVRDKLAHIVCESKFFAVLSDGSQARKTNSEKELVLVRVVHKGCPVYYAVALENIDDYGNATADNIKNSLDDVFQNENKIKIPEETYHKFLVSATADGASVNTGIYNGVLTQLKRNRPWLVTTHCVSHRLELAMKDSLMSHPQFEAVKDFMVNLFYYCKKSGKFVRNLNTTAEAFGTQAYKFPKVHGTRFLNHTRRGINTLLHNWPIILHSIENTLASQAKQEPKLLGYLKKLKNYTFLSQCCLYQQLVEKVAILSLAFEKGDLLVFEIGPSVNRTVRELQDLLGDDTLSEKNCGFTLSDDNVLSCKRHKAGHKRRMPGNREDVNVTCGGMTHTGDTVGTTIENIKSKAVPKMAECLNERFITFESELFKNCKWLDSANWHTEVADELKSIKTVADHFQIPLGARSYDDTNLKNEWKYIKHVVESYYQNFEPKLAWVKILKQRRTQCPNISLIVDLLLCLGMSNSCVEGGFSHLTAMLPDNRLSMAHKTMENLLLIKINDSTWSTQDREQIIESALDLFMTKRRKGKMHEIDEAQCISVDNPVSTDLASKSNCSSSDESDMDFNENQLIVSDSTISDSSMSDCCIDEMDI